MRGAGGRPGRRVSSRSPGGARQEGAGSSNRGVVEMQLYSPPENAAPHQRQQHSSNAASRLHDTIPEEEQGLSSSSEASPRSRPLTTGGGVGRCVVLVLTKIGATFFLFGYLP